MVNLYGDTPAARFGPLQLKVVRDQMIGHQTDETEPSYPDSVKIMAEIERLQEALDNLPEHRPERATLESLIQSAQERLLEAQDDLARMRAGEVPTLRKR